MKRLPAVAAVGCVGMAMVLSSCGGEGSSSGSASGGDNATKSGGADLTDGMQVAVLLPDTKSSARYLTQDEPGFKSFFKSKGMKKGKNFTVENAKGDPDTMRTQAEQAMSKGAKVLVIDGIDSGSAASIQKTAKDKGVATIDYDRLTLKGSASYYVSFDNTKVGKRQGKGLKKCIEKWNVKDPHVLEVAGAPTDNNATLFAKGANSILDSMYKKDKYTKVNEQRIKKWDPHNAQTYYEQQVSAHSKINAVLVANDDMANGVIKSLKDEHTKPKTVPTTGQDATVQGLQNILDGYQCMTVYKPIKNEVKAAGKLVVSILQGKKNPSSVNGKTNNKKRDVPSVLLKPISVTAENMAETVVSDKSVDLDKLCKGKYAAKCKKAGISK